MLICSNGCLNLEFVKTSIMHVRIDAAMLVTVLCAISLWLVITFERGRSICKLYLTFSKGK